MPLAKLETEVPEFEIEPPRRSGVFEQVSVPPVAFNDNSTANLELTEMSAPHRPARPNDEVICDGFSWPTDLSEREFT